MTASVLVDTSFLISLVDQNRANHQTATEYYRLMLELQVPIYLSAIVAAEFEIKQPIAILPLKKFRMLSFSMPHARQAALLENHVGQREEGTTRRVARDDVKLIAQAHHEHIPFILTEDASTLTKYCERLRQTGLTSVRAVILTSRFDRCAFAEDGQQGLSLGG